MRAGGTLRLFLCRPAAPAFDETLRSQIVPSLVARAAVSHVWAGRQGPDESGLRVIASLWTTEEGIAGGSSADGPEAHPSAAEPAVHILRVVRAVAEDAQLGSGILRVSRGTLHDVDVERYADAVLDGLASDLREGYGPCALVLTDDGEGGFVTVSAWSDWKHIEAATGATVHDPIRTRRHTRIDAFSADHYELLAAVGPPLD